MFVYLNVYVCMYVCMYVCNNEIRAEGVKEEGVRVELYMFICMSI